MFILLCKCLFKAEYPCKVRILGFTLAELLVVLGVLGVMAAFTIPKVLTKQQAAKQNSISLETASMISGAYQSYLLNNTPSSATGLQDLIPYMNYVSIDTTSAIDHFPTFNSVQCSNSEPCVTLHNGGKLWMAAQTFGGTTNLHSLDFIYDPDGVYSGSSLDSPSKSVQFVLYFNGFLTSRANAKSSTYYNGGLQFTQSNFDPSWFHWN